MITLTRALEIAVEIMKRQTRKQATELFGEWNDLVLFLESLKRAEDANTKPPEKK